MTPNKQILDYEYHEIEREITRRGYKWLFYEDFECVNLPERIEIFGECNTRRKMFNPDLRWFFGITAWVRWSAFRNDNDAVVFKLAYGDRATQCQTTLWDP